MTEEPKYKWTTEKRKVKDLIPWDKNPRRLTPAQRKQLENSLKKFGYAEIAAVNRDNNQILAGHQRLMLLTALGRGEEEIDVRVPDKQLTPQDAKEYNYRSNLNTGEWAHELFDPLDRELLASIGMGKRDMEKIMQAGNEKEDARAKIADRFIVAPFSTLDARSGPWQERKKAWLVLTGNIAETKENVLFKSETGASATYYFDKKRVERFLGRQLTNEEYEEKYYVPSYINQGSSGFDPVLAEVMYLWFNPKNGRILDPFGGEQTKGVVAGELGMQYTAVEFRQDQVDTNNEATKQYPGIKYYTGDSNNIDTIVPDGGYDLIFTSPPYYDLEVYSKEDMSSLGTYEQFMEQYKNIFTKAVAKLNDNRFVVVKIGEIRDKKTGVYRNFVADNIKIFQDLGLKYYNEMILITAAGNLAMRAPKQFNKARKTGKTHQNVLAFYKGPAENLFKESHAIYSAHQNILAFFKGDLDSIEETFGDVIDENQVIAEIMESNRESEE